MKSIILILAAIVISATCYAQHDFSIKPLPKIDFNSGVLHQNSSYMKFNTEKKSTDYLALLSHEIKDKPNVAVLKYNSKMPIAFPHGNFWNMPVAVPDSTINYAIREKRIKVLNSLEKK